MILSLGIYFALLAIVVLIVAFVFVKSILETQQDQTKAYRKLKDSGRIITLTDAVKLSNSGDGSIYRNHSSLPGEYWFIKKRSTADSRQFWDYVVEEGFLVESNSRRLEQDLSSLPEIKDLIESFED